MKQVPVAHGISLLVSMLAACSAPSSTAPVSPPPPARCFDGSAVAPITTAPTTPTPPAEDRLILERAQFSDLPGWADDAVEEAIPALLRSCGQLLAGADEASVGRTAVGGRVVDWRRACKRAGEIAKGDRAAARALFETEFVPLLAKNNDDATGRFTGYYEASLRGSKRRHGKYQTPLYRPPRDLVTVELSRFVSDGKGRQLVGRLVGDRLEPYDTRAHIVGGSLAGKKLELLWVDDPIDAFFVQIQGSGKVTLDTGGELRIGFAGKNGRPYTAIGRVLVEQGIMTAKTASMQAIRAYLLAHPERAAEVMNANESYVFFDFIKGDGPLGTQGVALVAGRSVAIDREFLPLSAPIWLDATSPIAGKEGDQPLRRLVIAQDTGGAIRGPVRGDVYWGGDVNAAEIAGRMNSRGRYFVLLPVAAADRLSTR
jgi:membrane-bound lytic murein transglycosylase A